MNTVFFSSIYSWPWVRQFPTYRETADNGLEYEGCRFYFSGAPGGAERFFAPTPETPDFWFTWDTPWQHRLNLNVPRSRRVLLVAEPPGYTTDYRPALRDHGVVVSGYDMGTHLPPETIQIIAPPLINWFYGVSMPPARNTQTAHSLFPDLAGMACPEKTRECAIVCSDLSLLPEHSARVLFYSLLQKVFKDRIDYFGRGWRYIDDKKEAIDSYKYAICLENNFCPNFWTEKIADAYLGYALPIYGGCPNITDFFPAQSVFRIDYRRPDEAVRAIAGLLDSDTWEKALPAIKTARKRLLYRYNLMPAVARLVSALRDLEAGKIGADELAGRYLAASSGRGA